MRGMESGHAARVEAVAWRWSACGGARTLVAVWLCHLGGTVEEDRDTSHACHALSRPVGFDTAATGSRGREEDTALAVAQ